MSSEIQTRHQFVAKNVSSKEPVDLSITPKDFLRLNDDSRLAFLSQLEAKKGTDAAVQFLVDLYLNGERELAISLLPQKEDVAFYGFLSTEQRGSFYVQLPKERQTHLMIHVTNLHRGYPEAIKSLFFGYPAFRELNSNDIEVFLKLPKEDQNVWLNTLSDDHRMEVYRKIHERNPSDLDKISNNLKDFVGEINMAKQRLRSQTGE